MSRSKSPAPRDKATAQPKPTIPLLAMRSRQAWRKWLSAHHASVKAIWLVFPKVHTGEKTVSYEEAVQEALCFGWIDSVVKRLDDDRYLRKFTPRKSGSKWSAVNRRRHADLAVRGLLAPPGRERAPTDRPGETPRPDVAALPADIERALKADARAWAFFQQLAPSYRRAYIGWIAAAKREETKQRRLREAVASLAAGRKLGLK